MSVGLRSSQSPNKPKLWVVHANNERREALQNRQTHTHRQSHPTWSKTSMLSIRRRRLGRGDESSKAMTVSLPSRSWDEQLFMRRTASANEDRSQYEPNGWPGHPASVLSHGSARMPGNWRPEWPISWPPGKPARKATTKNNSPS